MMPPICEICDKRFDPFAEEGNLLTFRLTPEQVESNKRFEQKGFTGHPAGTYWFCKHHMEIARRFAHLTSAEALKLIRESGDLAG